MVNTIDLFGKEPLEVKESDLNKSDAELERELLNIKDVELRLKLKGAPADIRTWLLEELKKTDIITQCFDSLPRVMVHN